MIMRSLLTIAVVAVTVAHVAPASPGFYRDWRQILDGPCRHCASSKEERAQSLLPLPIHALTWEFEGEFAQIARLCVIDLDLGKVRCRSRIGAGPNPPTWTKDMQNDASGLVDKILLSKIRQEAAIVWRPVPNYSQKVPPNFRIMPGCYEDRKIISGNVQRNFGEMGLEEDSVKGQRLRELVAKAIQAAGV
jgi:hypothetical protein